MSKNIKEIGKELLGRSLNSFHRKTGLTQLEKNNEMQDGILNGILSQVDDAYVEKTEQSNVIHLDGSGDGAVVLDSIEGNTLVNSLSANIIGHKGSAQYVDFSKIKPNTTYTFIYDISNSTGTPNGCFTRFNNINGSSDYQNVLDRNYDNGRYIVKYTTPSSWSRSYIAWFRNGTAETSCDFKMMVLEGDWTNKEIPQYFEGLQSSFEENKEDDKYKIEILMKNKNLLDLKNPVNVGYTPAKMEGDKIVLNSSGVEGERISMAFPVYMKKGSTYRFSYSNIEGNSEVLGSTVQMHPNLHPNGQFGISTKNPFTWDKESGIYYARIYNMYVAGTVKVNVQLEENSVATTYVEPKQNKIKLLINEPLRSVPNGTRDRLCVKENKLFVERNCYEYIITGNEDISRWGEVAVEGKSPFRINADVEFKYTPKVSNNNKGCFNNNRFINQDNAGVYYNKNGMCLWKPNANHFKVLGVCFDTNQLTSDTIEGCKQWFKDNKTVVVCELKEPYYEEVLNEYGEPIILEGYENGTLYIDSTVIPTTTVRYTPKMESFKTLKEVNKNNNLIILDINENIIPYMMDVDYMIMEKELCLLNTKNIRKMEELDMTSMQKRTQDMLERLIKGKTLTEQECKTRVTTYLNAGKITDDQAEELMLVISEVYA